MRRGGGSRALSTRVTAVLIAVALTTGAASSAAHAESAPAPAAPASQRQVFSSATFTAGTAPESTPTPSPTQSATPSPDATGTPVPTATPVPQPTATLSPTDPSTPTPAPSLSPTSTPTPVPTPAPGEPTPPSDDGATEVAPLAAPVAAVPTQARIAGLDRFSTSVEASRVAFPDGADTVLVASGYAPIDGVIAAGLSASLSAPLLYLQQSAIPDTVIAELRRLAPTTIIVVGGEPSVSAGVVGRLGELSPDVRRFGGADRYETSRMVLLGRGVPAPTVYLTGGGDLVDAPLASVAAAATGNGALLVNGLASPDAATLDALRSVAATSLVIVGGTAHLGAAYEQALRAAGFTVSRKAGTDRYDTSILMSRERAQPAQRAIVANSSSSADVAVAAALAAASGQQLNYAIEPCMPNSVAASLASLGVGVTAIGGPTWLGPAVLVNRSCTAETALRQNALDADIRAALAPYGGAGAFSVSVREIGGLGQYVQIGGGVRREPASMIKLFAAWAVAKIVDEGRANWGTRLPSGVDLANCVHVMIQASDNYCHTDIVHWIGIGELNRMIEAAGFCCTTYGNVAVGTSVLYAGNRSTTDDLVNLLTRLENGSILSRANSNHILNLMKLQVFRTRIASGIPPGVMQASKPGALWLTSGLLQADSAIVWGPKSMYAISIIGDQGPPQEALRRISRAVYEHFHGDFGAAAVYPVEQMYAPWPIVLLQSPNGSLAMWAPTGALIQVLDANRVWYLVRYNGRDVWTHWTNLRNR